MRRVIASVMDGGSVFELKPGYARNIVTALARLGGRPVGVVANQPLHLAGTLDSPACEKAAHFMSLCDAFGLPLVHLVDVPGFLVGTGAERSGLARRSGRLLYELGQATVPRLTVVLRKGYGLAYIAMSGGRSFSSDLCVAWPSAEISAMSVEGAVDVAYRREVEAAPDPAARRQEMITRFRRQLGPLHAAACFGVDEVIDPRDTRPVLIDALARCRPRRAAPARPSTTESPPSEVWGAIRWTLAVLCQREVSNERDPAGADGEQGGDAACWLALVCDRCGRLNEGAGRTRCEACGEPLPGDA